MKKTKWIIGAMVIVSILLSGCQAIFESLATPYGYVYDAITGVGIDSATVILTDADGVEYTVLTDSTGQYDFNTASTHPDYGDYSMTVTKTGYAFTPLEVSISGLAQRFAPVVGVSSTSSELLFVLMWDSGATLDVDAYMSYPNTGQTSINPYEAYVIEGSYGSGFAPEFVSPLTDRESVNPANTASTGNQIVMEVEDSNGTGPETISVSYTIPWTILDDSATLTPDTDIDPLLGNGDTLPVAWVGTLEYYIDGNSDKLSTQGTFEGSHPVLYVFDGATCLGIYKVPEYTNATVASLVRIQVLTDPGTSDVIYYIIYPDIRLLDSTADIRSINTEENAPLIVKRR